MIWRWKRLLGIGLVILIINGTLLIFSRQVFLESFIRLEQHRAYETLQRGVGVYQENLAFLESTTKDWANWDDAYQFMHNRDRAFVESNLVDSTFSMLHVNLILLLDETGQLVAGKAYDFARQAEVPVPGDLCHALASDKTLNPLKSHAQGVKGLISLPEGALMLAWQPILTGDGHGPPRGSLLMGRYLDKRELSRLGDKARLTLEFTRLRSGREWPSWSETPTETPEILLRVVNATCLRSRILLRDIFGAPAVVVAASLPRDIYAQGRQAMTYFNIWMLAVSLLGGGCIFVIWDRLVGSRQKQRDSEHLFQHLFQFSADAFFLCDEQGRFIDVNQQACAGLGYARQKLLSLSWSDIADVTISDLLSRSQPFTTAPPLPMETVFTGNRGYSFPGDVSVTCLELQGQSMFFVLVRDITERKTADKMLRKQKKRLNFLAYHDVLTSLPNRLKAIESLQGLIVRAKHRETTVAVLLFDLDRFKNINESLGHEIGDEILMEVARRIQGLLRDTDMVARFGGDEFLILLEPSTDKGGHQYRG